MRMKTKCLILLTLLSSLVFVFSSCSKYDDEGMGDTGGDKEPPRYSNKVMESSNYIDTYKQEAVNK